MKTIAVTGDKGGVGKSTVAGLLAQWFEFKNYTVNIQFHVLQLHDLNLNSVMFILFQ